MNDVSHIDSRPTAVRYSVLALLALAAGSAYLTRHCLAVANTTIQTQLGINNEQMGVVLGAFALGYLLCQVPGGWLGNRIGTRGALSLLSVLWSTLTIWTAAAGSLAPLVASRFTFGLAQAGLVPVSAQIIKDWFPVQRRGIVSAVITVAMSLGGALTMELTALLLNVFDWRQVFRMYSVVGIVWAMVFYAWFRTRPEGHSWVNAAEKRLIRGEPSGGGPQLSRSRQPKLNHARPSGAGSTAGPVTDRPSLLSINLSAICVQSFFRAAGYNLFVTFFPAFLEYAYGVSRGEAGRYAKWPLIGVIVGGLVGGLVVDRLLRETGNRWLSRSGVAVTALGVTALLTYASSWTGSAGGLVIVIALGATFSGMAGPATWAATIDIGGRNTAVISGIMNMAGCFAGVLVTPPLGRLIDAIKDHGGDWNLVIYLHAAFYLAAAVSWLFVNTNRSRADDESP